MYILPGAQRGEIWSEGINSCHKVEIRNDYGVGSHMHVYQSEVLKRKKEKKNSEYRTL